MYKYELVGFSEIDKSAANAYCGIHNVNPALNLGDICSITEDIIPDFDFICGGSPCQDFSAEGKKRGSVWTCKNCGFIYNPLAVHYLKRGVCPECGNSDIIHTRSSLIIELLRLVRIKMPKVLLFENVKSLVGVRNAFTFNAFREELTEYGYTVKYKVLDARDFGIPQARNRLYLVAVRNDQYKDWEMPVIGDDERAVADFLETEVDLKYYLNARNCEKFRSGAGLDRILRSAMKNGRIIADKTYSVHKERKYINCLTAREDRGLSLRSTEGTVIVERETEAHRMMNIAGISTTDGTVYVRKLTPRECWRFMGFTDTSFDRASGICSDGTLYRLAGNSVVVPVLKKIIKALFSSIPELFENMRLFSCFSGIGAFEAALTEVYNSI